MEIWWIAVIVLVIVIIISAMLSIANFTVEKFMDVHKEMSNKPANTNVSVLEFISCVNVIRLGASVKIAKTDAIAGDAYSQKRKTLVLSEQTLLGKSIASYSIAAHELGHALQDSQGNMLKHKIRLKKIGWVLAKLFLPCIISAVILLFFPQYLYISFILLGVAVGIFLLAVIFKLFSIHIETDATKRAIELLKDILPINEVVLAEKYLKVARLTYWSGFLRMLFAWTGLTKKGKLFED